LGRISRCACARAAGWLVAVAALTACSAAPEEPAPAGAWWVGRGPVVRALLAEASHLEGTPAGVAALQLGAVLPACDLVGARTEPADLALLILETRCLDDGDPLAVELRRGGGDVAFALPGVGATRARGSLRLDADALRADLVWPHPEADGVLALLLPARDAAAPARLARADRLAHARVRTRDGIDLAAWLPDASASQRLRAWLVGMLDGVVLDGTWEAAVYPPAQPEGLPGLAAALGVRSPRLATAAVERVLSDAARRWGAERSALHLAAGEGACLSALPRLPELAPCYVATDGALVFGWNRPSLLRALGPPGTLGSGDTASPGRIDVDLAKLLDAQAGERQPATRAAPTLPPWGRLRVETALEDDVLTSRLTLARREGAS
jgi:hypothetical protein